MVPAASRVIIAPTTLQMARVFDPLALASLWAAMVSAVSPDWVINFSSTTNLSNLVITNVIFGFGESSSAAYGSGTLTARGEGLATVSVSNGGFTASMQVASEFRTPPTVTAIRLARLAENVTTDEGKPGAKTTLTDPTLTQCMTGVFSKLQFPASGHSTSVGYPIACSP